jgi:hypothetical protein
MAMIPRWREWRGLAGINALIDFINQNTTGVGTLTSSKVDGAASSTDNAIMRFNGSTGKVAQNSIPIVQDDGRISTVTDPTSAQDAATKAYVDGLLGIVPVQAADPASPVNGTVWFFDDGGSPASLSIRWRKGGVTYDFPIGTATT